MARRTLSLEVEALLTLLWLAVIIGLPLLSWWMGPVDPPIPP